MGNAAINSTESSIHPKNVLTLRNVFVSLAPNIARKILRHCVVRMENVNFRIIVTIQGVNWPILFFADAWSMEAPRHCMHPIAMIIDRIVAHRSTVLYVPQSQRVIQR